jgi:glycosyltransferase involved in cell wall biosynthesis
VEGRRGISHSFALVNQHQLLALMDIPGLRLTHRDMPFAFTHWSRSATAGGFAADAQARIDALASNGQQADCVLRTFAPFAAPDTDIRTLTFMVTELGLDGSSFVEGQGPSDAFVRGGNTIVTPSGWSRERLLEAGFPADKVHIVPHGVDALMFRPAEPAERLLARASFGIAADEFVFLSIAAPLWTKGIDLILRSFALLRASGRKVRLLLKDQRETYGLSVDETVTRIAATCPELLLPDVRAAITVARGSLERDRLRLLYGAADCYLAPYRAEGFCLPALEAIACGLVPIVTAGGATDQFCDDDVALRIAGTEQATRLAGCERDGRFIEPDLGALVAAMEKVAGEGGLDGSRFAAARERILSRFTWRHAAEQLATLAARRPMLSVPRSAAVVRHIGQSDIIGLLRLLRPRAMARQGKVRIGNPHDGGYVLLHARLYAALRAAFGFVPSSLPTSRAG